ncbi:hypothetical protein P171DRAFT_461672 [Karstenula rhodostoma CBS 690.94]|uniref:CsbD-like domain-containing protein n=1 Tax=Karstenula rhodostoma CBS 690.94 TaxID=1392251 RepID=A0A9P4PR58_9PLEO|nr:hypothetical protein P171DRAFT_461672 [Karstenula rhodostoma CBS 690.94]
MSSNQQQPGLIAAHGQYAKGAAEEMVGQVTGLPNWKSSGQEDKTIAVDAMKKASENRDTSKGMGGIEEQAGNLVGCEGMQKEGADSKKQ